MMKRKVLDLVDPFIKGYSDYAYPLSVILNDPKSIEWIYCNFIQLYFSTDDFENPIRFYYSDFTNRHDRLWDVKNPFLDYQIIHKDTLEVCNVNIVEFLISMINLDNYVYLYLNESFMSTREKYCKERYMHVNLFYGYDLDKKVFFEVGYNKSAHYAYDEISFEEVQKAYDKEYRHFYNDKNMIYIFKLNKNSIQYNFDVNSVINQLKEYLNSSDPSRRYSEYLNDTYYLSYGMEVYEKYKCYLKEYYKNHSLFRNVKPIYMLWEHKRIMNLRLKYLVENGYLQPDIEAVKKYQWLEERYKIMEFMFIKFSRSGKVKLIDDIIRNLDLCIKIEKDTVTELINELSYNLR